MKKLEIIAIKTDNGYYIKNKGSSYSSDLDHYYFSGKKSELTHHKLWNHIDKKSLKIYIMKRQPNINHRFELKDKSMVCVKFPAVLKKEDVICYADGESYWKEEYSNYSSLYQEVSDKQPDLKEYVEFDFNVIMTIDNIKKYGGFSYPVQKTNWSHEGLCNVTEKDINYQIIDKILFPDIVLPSKPCQLTSHQSYKVIRQHVKQKIDYEVADITSDYEFCFTVCKRVIKSEFYDIKSKILKNLSNFGKKQISDNKIQIFQMTYSPENYKGYTAIKPFVGRNHDDLKEKIDNYLNELIKVINQPIINCRYCNGKGIREVKKFKTNK